MKNSVSDMLKNYAASSPARFHMPGHKGCGDFSLDVTEISATDDLTAPENALLTLEQRFKEVYRSKHSFLLVNGSTSGIHAFLLALGTNKRIIVSRDCHRCIIHGAALAGHDICFTDSQSFGDIEKSILSEKADALILTSPTYYGECAEISRIADLAHSHSMLLFVDAAHGAHFPFSDMLPHFPHDKADMWCTSAHKTLGALTQSAVLHIGTSCPFSKEHIRRILTLENTSSPSFLLMLSLEKALDEALGDAWDKHVMRIKALRDKTASLFTDITANGTDFKNTDITRLCLDVSKAGHTGYSAAQHLEANGIFPECADARRIVLITTPYDDDVWYERLIYALSSLERFSDIPDIKQSPEKYGTRKMGIREAVFSDIEYVPLKESAGRISAACIGIYPPGSPIIAPGEEIVPECIDFLMPHEDIYGTLNGAVPCVKSMNVI